MHFEQSSQRTHELTETLRKEKEQLEYRVQQLQENGNTFVNCILFTNTICLLIL
jgi:hypothetical protein